MTPDEYRRFTERLRDRLSEDARVLALVALGSTAAPEMCDEHSDHDFWVVVRPGERAGFLADLSWMPEAPRVVATVRQGSHYGTILYASGHVAEFGVFEVGDLSAGRLGRWSLLLDRHEIAAELAKIAERSLSRTSRLDDRPECELLLVTLLTGARRAARGELLSAHKYLAYFALDILLGLLSRRAAPTCGEWSDPLDPWRRFESVEAALAAELLATVRLSPIRAAECLLEIAVRELAPAFPEFPGGAAEVVRRALAELRSPEDGGGNLVL